MNPVGPLDPKVYWVRRVSIVVLAVAVLIGLVWFLASRSSRSSAGQELTSAAVTGAAAPTLTGVLAASTALPTPASPSASPSPSGPALASGSPVSGATPSGSPVASAAGSTAATPGASGSAPAKAGASPSAGPASSAAAATAPQPTAKATATPPPAKATGKPALKPAPAPAPSYAPDGTLLCPDAAIAVTAISTAPTFTSGSQPMLGMTVTNTGTAPCRRDVSGTLQTYTVQTAGGKRVWSTADCFPGEGTEERNLAPGQTVQYTIKWSGRASAPRCTGDRAQAPPGKYVVVAQLGKLSGKPAAFSITG